MSRITLLLYNPFRHDARVLRHASALAEAGHEVRVVATLEGDLPAAEMVAGFEVVRLDHDPRIAKLARRLIAMRRGGPAAIGTVVDQGALQAKGSPSALLVRAVLGLHLVLAWLRFRSLALRAVADGADLWIANDLDMLPVAAAAKRRFGGRVLYDAHELYVELVGNRPKSRAARAMQAAVERHLIRRVERTVTVNESIADELARRYGVPRPGVVMNVPDRRAAPTAPDRQRLRAALGVGDDRRVALYVGGIGAGRGIEQLVRASAHLDDVTIALIGPVAGDYRGELEALTNGAGAVRVLPAVAETAVLSWAAGADVGLVPYRNTCLNNYLSLPNKLFEYLAAGVPVVASDFPELRRVIEGEGVGVTCDPEDPADIARAVRSVVDDPVRHARFRAGALRAGERFNWERERPKLSETVTALLELS